MESKKYYLVKMSQQKFKKIRAKHNLTRRSCGCCYSHDPANPPGLFTKKEIDRFPRYMRRGGEYEH